jgi:hypothetical protein
MTEKQWLACTDPTPMLEFLRGKVSDRKLRLFAVASFGRLVALLPDPRQRRGIEVLEQLAEGTVTKAACRGVTAEVRQAIPQDDWVAGMPPTDHLHYIALMLYREFCSSSIAVHAIAATAGLADGAGEQHEQVRLMRDIAGPFPFRPVTVDQSWLRRNDGTVVKLAQAIYEERAFDRLPILADAVMDAGCNNDDILSHCRSEGPHVRGCWVVDLLLGQE